MTALLTTLGFQVLANITVNGNLSDRGYVKFPDVHAAYKIYEELATWNEARERCMAEGADLAITDSFEKIAHVKSMRNQSEQWLHVGIYNFLHTDRWNRIDNGLPVASMPWAYGFRNGFGNCAGISIFLNGLVDYTCNGKQEYFVCEVQIFEDNNSTESSDQGSTPLMKSAEELPEGYTVFPDIGVAYKFYEPSPWLTWNAARKYCETEGGNLATIDSSKKIEYLKSLGLTKTHAWVGIYRFAGSDEWISVKHGFLETPLPWISDSGRDISTYQCARVADVGLLVGECTATNVVYFICEVSIFKDLGLRLTQSLQLN